MFFHHAFIVKAIVLVSGVFGDDDSHRPQLILFSNYQDPREIPIQVNESLQRSVYEPTDGDYLKISQKSVSGCLLFQNLGAFLKPGFQ
jgi:hypothetical protein